ncbi:MAG: hypothetical protein JWR24_3268 [Actinoallomurus sp.]|nr:hypothetical protein [Actinoallomurus sp.]
MAAVAAEPRLADGAETLGRDGLVAPLFLRSGPTMRAVPGTFSGLAGRR